MYREFYLDDQHADYASIISDLETFGEAHQVGYYANVAGRDANRRVVKTWMTDAEVAANSPSLAIGAANCVKDQWNYKPCVNANRADAATYTNAQNEQYTYYGKFLLDPPDSPYDPIDRQIEHYKGNTTEAILFINAGGSGAADGSSYLDAADVEDCCGSSPIYDPEDYDLIVFAGRLSHFWGGVFGDGSLRPKTGTPASWTEWVAHAEQAERPSFIGGPKLGNFTTGAADADWTDNADGASTANGFSTKSIDIGTTLTMYNQQFAMSDDGGTLRALTKVGSLAECQATPDSWFPEANYSGSHDRITVLYASSDADPKDSFYCRDVTTIGICAVIQDRAYFRMTGLDFYMPAFRGSDAYDYNSGHFENCGFHYYAGPMFASLSGSVNEGTGAYSITPHPSSDRRWNNCEGSYCKQFIYDIGFTLNVSLGTVVQYCWFHDIGLVADDAFGINLFSSADHHVLATQGYDDFFAFCCRFEGVGCQTITHYMSSANFADPVPLGLENMVGYAQGWGFPDSCVMLPADSPAGDYAFCQIARGGYHAWNWFTDILSAGVYDAAQGMGISFNGDSPNFGVGSLYDDNVAEYNRLEGDFDNGAIRSKLCFATANENPGVLARLNIIRGSSVGLRLYQTSTVHEPAEVFEPSIAFEYNSVHCAGAAPKFVKLSSSANPDFHRQYLDSNHYVDANGAQWEQGLYSYSPLATWQGLAPAGDTYDDNSSHDASFTIPTLPAGGGGGIPARVIHHRRLLDAT